MYYIHHWFWMCLGSARYHLPLEALVSNSDVVGHLKGWKGGYSWRVNKQGGVHPFKKSGTNGVS